MRNSWDTISRSLKLRHSSCGSGIHIVKRLTTLLFVTIIIVILYGQIEYTIAPYSTWDLAGYRRMAAAAPAIATDICQPAAFRVLGPWLAGLLPVPDPVAFYALAVLMSIVLVLLSYHFFRVAGLAPAVAVIVVILYTFNRWWFGTTVWDYFQLNDLLSQIWIVLLFLAMLQGRWAIFGVVFLLAALTRETGMLMIPVAAVYLWERKELRQQGPLALAAIAPGVALFVALRMVIPAPCGKPLFEQLLAHSGSILSPVKVARLLINSYLPFSLLPFVFFNDTIRYFRGKAYALVFVTLVFLSTLFGLAYDERLLAPSFVVIYALIGSVIQANWREKWFVALLVIAGFLSTFHHLRARFPLPDRDLTLVLSLGALALVTAASIAIRWRARTTGGRAAPET